MMERDKSALLKTIGLRVRNLRIETGLTIRELAVGADLSLRFINQLEAGQGNISIAGLARVAFEREDHERVLADLATDISPRILRAAHRTETVARQLDEYFDGRRRNFDLAVDLQLAHGFRHEVLVHLRAIAYGRTESYAEVARATGRPAAVRAAASACSHNPVPVVVPCHRVVRSDGSIGQYLGGPEMKAALLAMEAA